MRMAIMITIHDNDYNHHYQPLSAIITNHY